MKIRNKILDINNLKEAMVSKNKDLVGILRFLKSEIQKNEGGKREMTENEIVNLIKKNIETTSGYFTNEKNEKTLDLIFREDRWEEKVKILESFLPKQLSESEIETIIDEMISNGINNIGQLMGGFTKKYAGRADGRLLSSIVKEKIKK